MPPKPQSYRLRFPILQRSRLVGFPAFYEDYQHCLVTFSWLFVAYLYSFRTCVTLAQQRRYMLRCDTHEITGVVGRLASRSWVHV